MHPNEHFGKAKWGNPHHRNNKMVSKHIKNSYKTFLIFKKLEWTSVQINIYSQSHWGENKSL